MSNRVVLATVAVFFLASTAALAMAFLPALRGRMLAGVRRVRGTLSHLAMVATRRAGSQSVAAGDRVARGMVWLAASARRHAAALMLTAAALVLLPAAALLLRQASPVETFDHRDARDRDPRVTAMLEGEQLVPPAPLPPELFTTPEVEQARPMIRFASRQWELLDAEFRQRLLLVFKAMRERHGYELVLLEGYRSPERQQQLAAASLDGKVLTRAGAGRSYHQYGLAADVAFLRAGRVVISERDPWAMQGYERYGEEARAVGLTWGGGWKGLRDFGHVELRRPGVLPPARPSEGAD